MTPRLLCAALLLSALSVPGCLSPPRGTVWLDLDGDGIHDFLAKDDDLDGIADTDPVGRPLPALSSEDTAKVKAALAADKFGPDVLGIIATAFGIPVLGLIGIGWRASKLGQMFVNAVLSVQAGRKALRDTDKTDALAILDAALTENQTGATADKIKAIKIAERVPPVT